VIWWLRSTFVSQWPVEAELVLFSERDKKKKVQLARKEKVGKPKQVKLSS
jgi:hypothetical protein